MSGQAHAAEQASAVADRSALARPALSSLALARLALARQLWQSALAVSIALLGAVLQAAILAATMAGVAEARRRHAPLGEAAVLLGLNTGLCLVVEELGSLIARGRGAPWLLGGVIALQVGAWALAVAVAKQLGVEDIGAASVPIAMLIYLVCSPVAALLRPTRQPCGARLRRAGREVAMGVVRTTALSGSASVVLYVYLTVFSQMDPGAEVAVMGLAMPMVQAAMMTLLARLVRRHMRVMRKVEDTKTAPAPAEAMQDTPLQNNDEEARKQHGRGRKHRRRAGVETLMAMMMITGAEMIFSTGAFTALVLVESDGAFLLSLVAMLIIEVVQVALHVKARRVVAQVVSESTAHTILGDEVRLRQWLLHVELGEKVGLLGTISFLAIGHSFDYSILQAVAMTQLVHRGLVMALLGLVGDLCKDLASRALGLVPRADAARSVSLSPLGFCIFVLQCAAAGVLAQAGLALGSATLRLGP